MPQGSECEQKLSDRWILESLEIECKYSSKGCKAVAEMKEHESECKYRHSAAVRRRQPRSSSSSASATLHARIPGGPPVQINLSCEIGKRANDIRYVKTRRNRGPDCAESSREECTDCST